MNQSPHKLLTHMVCGLLCKTYASGEFVYRACDPCKYVFVVASGRVKTYTQALDGHQSVLTFVNEDDILGEESIVAQAYDNYAVAVVPTTLACIRSTNVRAAMKKEPDLASELFQLMYDRRKIAERRLAIINHKSTSQLDTPGYRGYGGRYT